MLHEMYFGYSCVASLMSGKDGGTPYGPSFTFAHIGKVDGKLYSSFSSVDRVNRVW